MSACDSHRRPSVAEPQVASATELAAVSRIEGVAESRVWGRRSSLILLFFFVALFLSLAWLCFRAGFPVSPLASPIKRLLPNDDQKRRSRFDGDQLQA